MVAIRQTHTAHYDFQSWLEALQLPLEWNEQLHAAHLLLSEGVMRRYHDQPQAERLQRSVQLTSLSCEIAGILITLNMDLTSLVVAVLYPALEYNCVTIDEVRGRCGDKPAALLENVRHMEAIRFLQNLHRGTPTDVQIDRVRRMLLAMVEDVRAVVIKLAERIAVIRAIKNESEERRVLVAREIADIYAPLANRLGIGQLKWELEDLSFRYLHPDLYKQIALQLDERRVDREQYIQNFVTELRELLTQEGIKAEVYGRPKHIYSIYRKMQRKQVQFSELYDVRAVRIIVERIQDCYAALGVVHTRWHHIPSEFDDYIANPKANGYQSIHTVVYGDGGKAVEIQIRTASMHSSAELGVAAHWKYKEGQGLSSGVEQRINWLRKLLSWRDDMVGSGALLEEFRTQVFEDRVYVFTPKGEVIDLPTGSTPLDFAYQVHTMVGHRCIGAKVNGRIVPFTYRLKTGEQVEIITQKNPNPSRDWLNPDNGFLKTAKARSKVQAFFRKVDYDRNREAGEEMVERECSRHGLNLSHDTLAAALTPALTRFNVRTMSDLYAGVGAGDVSVGAVLAVLREHQDTRSREEREDELNELIAHKSDKAVATRRQSATSSVVVDSVGNLLTHLAHCCRPIPGDEIAGFITQGAGVSIHRRDCPQYRHLVEHSPERAVSAEWGAHNTGGYTVTLRIVGQEISGFLKDVTAVLSEAKLNVLGLRSRVDRQEQVAVVDIDLLIVNVPAFNKALASLNELPAVLSARRV
ncbi:MAG: GTP diphosphokinase [Succinivibrio sp.]|nr:GTP diphosphokinase [Succinivibrio sp.]